MWFAFFSLQFFLHFQCRCLSVMLKRKHFCLTLHLH